MFPYFRSWNSIILLLRRFVTLPYMQSDEANRTARWLRPFFVSVIVVLVFLTAVLPVTPVDPDTRQEFLVVQLALISGCFAGLYFLRRGHTWTIAFLTLLLCLLGTIYTNIFTFQTIHD